MQSDRPKLSVMDYQYLLIEQKGAVQIITIHRPEALNALNGEVLGELDAAFTEAACEDATRVVILTGEGKSFVAGADIAEMAPLNAAEGKAFGEMGSEVFRRIELLNKPVIAAVNGFALGGGCELAMACDLRVASTKAKFGQPEVGLGITPGFSGTQRLSRLVGLGKAKEMIFTGDAISSAEALACGLVNVVCEPEALLETALALAEKIASKAPVAVRYAKEAIQKGIDIDMDSGIATEANLFGLCFATEDQKEGMKAFLEKRPAAFKGR